MPRGRRKKVAEPVEATAATETVGQEPFVAVEDAPGEGAEVVREEQYWYGAVVECPWQNVAAGGLNFPRWSQQTVAVEGDPNETMPGPKVKGIISDLEDEVVDRVKKDVADKVIVWDAGIGKGKPYIRRLSDKKYKRRPAREEPLGKYLYLLPTKSMKEIRRDKEPTQRMA